MYIVNANLISNNSESVGANQANVPIMFKKFKIIMVSIMLLIVIKYQGSVVVV